jgi:hypothetical protein
VARECFVVTQKVWPGLARPARLPATPEQRRRLRVWARRLAACQAAWRARHGDAIPPPVWPPYPVDLVWLSCGARTRAGTPCKRPVLLPAGRCRLHGGRSTGPRTAAGKARSAANGRCPKRKAAPA